MIEAPIEEFHIGTQLAFNKKAGNNTGLKFDYWVLITLKS
jgi:hypothetical protein